jgi:hypothetical protein
MDRSSGVGLWKMPAPAAWVRAVGGLVLACAAASSTLAAPPAKLDLNTTLGQGFSAYERSLGKPAGEREDAAGSVRWRTYRPAGFVLIRLGQSLGSETVNRVELGFPRDRVRSWKAAFAQVGLPTTGITLARGDEGFEVRGLPQGWLGTWTPNDAGSRSHLLQLWYAGTSGQGEGTASAGQGKPAAVLDVRALVGQPREAVEAALGTPARAFKENTLFQYRPAVPNVLYVNVEYPQGRAKLQVFLGKRMARKVLAALGLPVARSYALPLEDGNNVATEVVLTQFAPRLKVVLSTAYDNNDVLRIEGDPMAPAPAPR